MMWPWGLKIGIPVRFKAGDGGGIETHAVNLIGRLQKVDRRNRYFLFCTVHNEKVFNISSRRFSVVSAGRKIPPAMTHEKIPRYLDPVHKLLSSAGGFFSKKLSDVDLVHFMFTILPPDLLEVNFSKPLVLTVHDIQQEYHPGFFTREILEFRKRMYRPSVEKVDHIIAISEFTKMCLIEKYDVPEEKITIVYNGFEKDMFKPLDSTDVQPILRKYGLPDRYFFYPAATWPHKNHINLIRAYKILKDTRGIREKMVWTGVTKENHGAVFQEAEKLGVLSDIVHLGYVSFRDLPAMFNGARLLVFPSFFEGFGIPVLEAMGTGLPIACADATSLPEVAGDAAVYFDPNDPEDMAEKIHCLNEDEDLRERLIRRGFERSALFSWERAAGETLKVYVNTYRNFC
jgi:glycosyltransferase involved in cell wall biosynthesis